MKNWERYVLEAQFSSNFVDVIGIGIVEMLMAGGGQEIFLHCTFYYLISKL